MLHEASALQKLLDPGRALGRPRGELQLSILWHLVGGQVDLRVPTYQRVERERPPCTTVTTHPSIPPSCSNSFLFPSSAITLLVDLELILRGVVEQPGCSGDGGRRGRRTVAVVVGLEDNVAVLDEGDERERVDDETQCPQDVVEPGNHTALPQKVKKSPRLILFLNQASGNDDTHPRLSRVYECVHSNEAQDKV
jgi:hypothetical protein